MRDAVPTNDEFSAPQHTHNTQHQLFRGAPQAQRMSLAAAVKNDAMAIRKRLLAKKCSCSAQPRLRLPPSVGRLKPTADARNVVGPT